MKTETVALSSLKEYSKNAKQHPADQVEAIAYSLTKFGQTNPLIVDKTGTVVAGHGRLLAMKKLGWTEAKILRVDEWTEDMAKEYRILENKSAESFWDLETLNRDLATFDSYELVSLFPELEPVDLDNVAYNEGKSLGEKEIDIDGEEFAHTCPVCKFKFN